MVGDVLWWMTYSRGALSQVYSCHSEVVYSLHLRPWVIMAGPYSVCFVFCFFPACKICLEAFGKTAGKL
jgi:hypothetical protein